MARRSILSQLFRQSAGYVNCIGALFFLRLEEEFWRSPYYDSKRIIGFFFTGGTIRSHGVLT